jgi:hypothetical protein
MNAIGLNPIKLDAIGLDPIRMNAIRLGVPVASSGSGRPYIDPELLSHVKMAISTWGKTNDDTDRAILKDLSGNGNDMRLLNFGFAEGSGYGLPGTDFEGWLCTDGVDDMIESVKPVSEMLEGSNEITVVSIIHQISFDPKNNLGFTNYINYQKDSSTRMYFRNNISDIGKTGIYGYTYDGTTLTGIYNILGDKADYNTVKSNNIDQSVFNGKLSVCGCTSPGGYLSELSQIAYAGGFIANKVLTTDEINQIIAYYNLDRPGQIIKPQLYYNIKKQGITNDNHAEFNDQLIDFINGHNIQLNNIGWEGESGINSYPVVFGANKTWGKMASSNNTDFIFELTGNSIHLTKADDNLALLFTYVYKDGTVNEVSIPTFKLKVTGLKEGQNVVYNYVSEDNVSDITSIRITEDGEYVCPKSTIFVPEEILSNVWIGFKVNPENIDLDITIEVLPTIEHALSLDGINDFGKVTGLPVLKDYTVAALRKWLYDDSVTSTETGSIVSKSKVGNGGAFILEQTFNRNPSRSSAFSFGTVNSLMNNDKLNEESFTYQTKYSYNGNPIQAGAGIDSDSMWLGTIRDGGSRFSKLALWSLMLFPYSLSEFLLERQLRKYKAGTLYPDMIEFRPIVKSNIPYSSISYSVNPGEYIAEGSRVTITITLSNETDKLVGVSSNAISDISISGDNGTYEITGKITKPPQKINIVISSYLTMLDNETLISNETLIKNE